MTPSRLQWGESARWDDRRDRLYVVDCATRHLHWATAAGDIDGSMPLPSTPTGVVLTDTDDLAVCLDDGIHLVHPDAGTVELVAPYPAGMVQRANDAAGDTFGNLVTGTLNLSSGPGSLWRFGIDDGWRRLADDVGSVNGPAVVTSDGWSTLFCGDTTTGVVNAWDYDPTTGACSGRRVVADFRSFGGTPDGSAVDADGGVWTCVLGAGRLVRLTHEGSDTTVDLPMTNPTDIAFGGDDLGRAFVTSLPDTPQGERTEPAGMIYRIDDLAVGRLEPRFTTA